MKTKNIVIVSAILLVIALLMNQFIKNNKSITMINSDNIENAVVKEVQANNDRVMEEEANNELATEDITEVGNEAEVEDTIEVSSDAEAEAEDATEESTEAETVDATEESAEPETVDATEESTETETEDNKTETENEVIVDSENNNIPSIEEDKSKVDIIEPTEVEKKSTPEPHKTRVIAMTDGEKDDQASMVRFLLYSNEMEIEAIIQTNSFYQTEGHSRTSEDYWLENQIEAYGEIVSNLRVHDTNYPTEEFLLSRIYVGDEDPLHVIKNHADAVPPFENTDGSNRIIEVLLDSNSSPVWIQAWGGLNTVAQAFYELKYSGNYSEDDYKKATQKAKIYSISFQDNSGKYIQEHFPEILMIKSFAFAKTWGYNNPQGEELGSQWVEKYIKNHGLLSDLYPKKSILEGDTPSFLNFLDNGLRAYIHPTYGGWGGRFKYSQGLYVDSFDQGSETYSIERFIHDAQNDFAMKLDWCITSSYTAANHRPYAIVDKEYEIKANPGDTIRFSGSDSFDPDGDELTFLWWQYVEADSATKNIIFKTEDTSQELVITIPKDIQSGKTIHLILEVSDNGSPSVTSYRRTIIRIN